MIQRSPGGWEGNGMIGIQKEALFYEHLERSRVHCHLCFHHCLIPKGKRGKCGVRENRGGTLYTLVYGKSIAQSIDPIEKKPLFHFYPGSRSFSVATMGCNFRCLHCQNFHISQVPGEESLILGDDLPPERIVELALKERCSSISYTYTEPTIFFEYALETARVASRRGLKNVFVTNGYITPEPLKTIQPHLHAANIDLKFFKDETYREVCGARLRPVLDSIRLYKELGIWLEITTLIIPGYNDSREELEAIAGFIARLGAETPWHVSRFYPTHRLLDRPRTPVDVLHTAGQVGLDAGLRYVYTGNVSCEEGENTYCHRCGRVLIRRRGFAVMQTSLSGSRCPGCGTTLDGVGFDNIPE